MEQILQLFLISLLVFHTSEFCLAAVFMRDQLGWKSWLISRPYAIAMTAAVAEYAVDVYLLPGLKRRLTAMSSLGLAMIVAGEVIRKLGMVTAQSNFTHDIRRHHSPEHRLVTHGIYRYIRHPGYLGFFLWSVGTQMLLANPICTIGFIVVTWRFFRHRIAYEEFTLRKFFGSAYSQYAARTPCWIPFLDGALASAAHSGR